MDQEATPWPISLISQVELKSCHLYVGIFTPCVTIGIKINTMTESLDR